jgi:hypothetical protein
MSPKIEHTAQRGMRLSMMAAGMLCAVSLAASAAPQASKPARMPRGSYLQKPVNSTAQLVNQFANDPKVVERYSRVFHMEPAGIRSALGEMRLTRLKKDMVMNVYYVRPGEKLGYRVRRVKKGTEVFVLPDGTPVLVKACGNPLRHTIPGQKLTRVPDFNPDEALPTEELNALPLPEETNPSRMTPSVATAPPLLTATPPSELEEAIVLVSGGGATGDFVEDIAALPLGFLAAGGGGAAGGAALAGLTKGILIAGGAAAVGSFVSNSGGGSTPPTTPTPPTNPTPPGGSNPPSNPPPPGLVPEWDSTVLFLCAIAGASVPAYIRRRRSAA